MIGFGLCFLLGMGVLGVVDEVRKRRDHVPRAVKLVLEPPRPVCCSWCCPSGHFRGTMPPSYSTRCRCTGCSGHPVRERGAPFLSPPPWEAEEQRAAESRRAARDDAYRQPPPTSIAPPPHRRSG